MLGEISTNSKSFIIESLGYDDSSIAKFVQEILDENKLNEYGGGIGIFDQKGYLRYSNERFIEDLPITLKDASSPIEIEHIFNLEKEVYPLSIENNCIVRYSFISLYDEEMILYSYQDIDQILKTFDTKTFCKVLHFMTQLLKEKYENDFMLDSLYDLVTIVDKKGNIVRTNSSIYQKFGINKNEIIGKNIFDLVQNGVVTNSVTKEVLDKKTEITRSQDTQQGRCLAVTGYPIFDPKGEIFRVINISKDITEINTLEEKLNEAETMMYEYEKQLKRLRKSPNFLITSSIKMQKTLETIKNITNIDSTVLIEGETGVGKGVLANTIHNTSIRNKYPIIKINCAAIPENLFESVLFGYEKGSFTGGLTSGKSGLITEANQGTLFLDEIGDLPINMQTKLLDLIQNKTYYSVGGTKPKSADIRIIAATNRNLKEQVKLHTFREDLYYRLAVIPIYVPSLRDRKDEIPILISDFLEKYNTKYLKTKHLSRECIKFLEQYSWPGNIRELENLIERLVVTSTENLITSESLPENIKTSSLNVKNMIEIKINNLIPLKDAYELIDEALIKEAYEQCHNNSKIADMLGVHRATIIRKVQKYIK